MLIFTPPFGCDVSTVDVLTSSTFVTTQLVSFSNTSTLSPTFGSKLTSSLLTSFIPPLSVPIFTMSS